MSGPPLAPKGTLFLDPVTLACIYSDGTAWQNVEVTLTAEEWILFEDVT